MGVGISTVKAFFWATGIQFSSVQFTDQLAFASIGVLFFCDTYKNETSGCSEKVPNVLEYTFASTHILSQVVVPTICHPPSYSTLYYVY